MADFFDIPKLDNKTGGMAYSQPETKFPTIDVAGEGYEAGGLGNHGGEDEADGTSVQEDQDLGATKIIDGVLRVVVAP